MNRFKKFTDGDETAKGFDPFYFLMLGLKEIILFRLLKVMSKWSKISFCPNRLMSAPSCGEKAIEVLTQIVPIRIGSL